MTGKQLFWQRVRDEWKFQIGIIPSVFDWSVIVYFVISALIIFPFIYRDVWNREADLLFLVQKRKLYDSLKRWGLHYSLSQIVISTILLLILLLPILHSAYHFTFSDILNLFNCLVAYRLV